MSKPPRETDAGDIAFNKSLLFHGDSTRTSQSWLSKSLNINDGITSVENEEEEIEIIGDEEEGGLGYHAPSNTIPQDRQSLSANDKLRKQLLGHRNTQIKSKGKHIVHKSDMLTASKPKPQSKKSTLSDDDDEGRTIRTQSKSRINAKPGVTHSASKGNSKKRPASFLDEVLAKRQQKNKKS